MSEGSVGQPPDGTLSPDGAWRWDQGHWVAVSSQPSPSGPPSDDPNAPPLKHPTRRHKPIYWVIGSLLSFAAVVTAVLLFRQSEKPPVRVSVQGHLVIVGGGGYNKDDPCHGVSGGGDDMGLVAPFDYTDLQLGTPVKVLSASGVTIGTGSFSDGSYLRRNGVNGGDGCRFSFNIPLDHVSPRYELVIANRPPYDFDDPHALDLVVGPH
jgi:hypothetical protein